MSPQSALASEVFRFYCGTVVGILVVSGILLAVLRWGLKRNVSHAWKAYRGWLVMVPVVIAAIFCGARRRFSFSPSSPSSVSRNLARATGLYRDWPMTGLAYAGILAVGGTALVRDPTLHVPGWYGLFAILPVYVIAAILLVPIVRNRSQGQLQAMALATLGFLYVGWMFGHVAFLAERRRKPTRICSI